MYILKNEKIISNNIIIAGDSAGGKNMENKNRTKNLIYFYIGGLVVSSLMSLKRRSIPLPRCAVLLSPFVDLKCAHTDSYGYCYISKNLVDMIADQYLNSSLKQQKDGYTETSPVKGDLTGLPPMLIQAGSVEILLNEIKLISENAQKYGVQVTYVEYDHMPHVFQAFHMISDVGRKAITDIGIYCYEQLNSNRYKYLNSSDTDLRMNKSELNPIWRVASTNVL